MLLTTIRKQAFKKHRTRTCTHRQIRTQTRTQTHGFFLFVVSGRSFLLEIRYQLFFLLSHLRCRWLLQTQFKKEEVDFLELGFLSIHSVNCTMTEINNGNNNNNKNNNTNNVEKTRQVPDVALRWILLHATTSNVELANLSNICRSWRDVVTTVILEQATYKTLPSVPLLLLPSMASHLIRMNRQHLHHHHHHHHHHRYHYYRPRTMLQLLLLTKLHLLVK